MEKKIGKLKKNLKKKKKKEKVKKKEEKITMNYCCNSQWFWVQKINNFLDHLDIN